MSFVFRHPKYYKKIRDANKDQAISKESPTRENQRAPGPGLKQQAIDETVPHNDIEEANKPTSSQALSDKRPSHKPRVQASSQK